jgi:hypothetical protein
VYEIADRHHRDTGHDVFTGLDVLRQHDAGQRSAQYRVTEPGPGELDRVLRLVQPGACPRDLLLARSLAHERGLLARFLESRHGHLMRAARGFERLPRCDPLLEQALLPIKFQPGALDFSLSPRHRGLRHGDFLPPRTDNQRGQLRLVCIHLGFAKGDFLGELGVIEVRDHVACPHELALGDRARFDPARNPEAHLDIGRLDIAGDADQVRIVGFRKNVT